MQLRFPVVIMVLLVQVASHQDLPEALTHCWSRLSPQVHASQDNHLQPYREVFIPFCTQAMELPHVLSPVVGSCRAKATIYALVSLFVQKLNTKTNHGPSTSSTRARSALAFCSLVSSHIPWHSIGRETTLSPAGLSHPSTGQWLCLSASS